jgi:iron complex transport system ATP-binding protein
MSAPALIEIEDAEVFRGDTRVFEGLSSGPTAPGSRPC